MYGMLWNVWKVLFSFRNSPYIKKAKVLNVRGMDVWRILWLFSLPMSKLIKKMYTNKEISIIVENCNSTFELIKACVVFKYLIEIKELERSAFLEIKTLLRFRKLEKLEP